MKTIKPIILSYNLPEETDQIYAKLVNDGFKDIIVVDNGSDKCPPAKSANLLLPKNIRVTGQAKIALIYCMDYFPADYYWLITTSAVLLDRINYQERIQQAFKDLDMIKVGILSPSIIGGNYFDLPCQKHVGNENKRYSTCDFQLQLIGAIVSHELIEMCRRKRKAYFNFDLYRGHGLDWELCYIALKNNFWPIVDYNMQIEWIVNSTFKRGVDVETREEYHKLAGKEYVNSFIKQYGQYWKYHFNNLYLKKLKELKDFPYFKYQIPEVSIISIMIKKGLYELKKTLKC